MGDFIDVSRLILEHAEGVRTPSSYLLLAVALGAHSLARWSRGVWSFSSQQTSSRTSLPVPTGIGGWRLY